MRSSGERAGLLVNLDISAQLNVTHGLRRDQNKLPSNRTAGSLDHHFHADVTINIVHKDVAKHGQISTDHTNIVKNDDLQLVQAANRRTHGFPD